MHDFNKLKVWNDSFASNKKIYEITASFPKEEFYGITNQIRRASISICSNIAEGCGRKTNKDFIHFLYNSLGSLKEVQCQLKISKSLNYLSNEDYLSLNKELEEISKELSGLIIYLQKSNKQ